MLMKAGLMQSVLSTLIEDYDEHPSVTAGTNLIGCVRWILKLLISEVGDYFRRMAAGEEPCRVVVQHGADREVARQHINATWQKLWWNLVTVFIQVVDVSTIALGSAMDIPMQTLVLLMHVVHHYVSLQLLTEDVSQVTFTLDLTKALEILSTLSLSHSELPDDCRHAVKWKRHETCMQFILANKARIPDMLEDAIDEINEAFTSKGLFLEVVIAINDQLVEIIKDEVDLTSLKCLECSDLVEPGGREVARHRVPDGALSIGSGPNTNLPFSQLPPRLMEWDDPVVTDQDVDLS